MIKYNLPKIALIGCGAAALKYALPVLRSYDGFHENLVLIDNNTDYLKKLSSKLGVQNFYTNYNEVLSEVCAVIISTPHNTHAPISKACLEKKCHVFVEKPIALKSDDAKSVVKLSKENDLLLMVNNSRRLFPSYKYIKSVIETKEFGEILSIKIEDGSKFAWESVSNFYIKYSEKGQGVLLDRGAHTLDILCWWINGRPNIIDSSEDSFGGSEAVAILNMDFQGIPLDIKFSRLFKLNNKYKIQFENALVTGDIFDTNHVIINQQGVEKKIKVDNNARSNDYYAQLLIRNYIESVSSRSKPLFLADEVVPSITLIEEAYKQTYQLNLHWYETI